jgi:hypothetical protein
MVGTEIGATKVNYMRVFVGIGTNEDDMNAVRIFQIIAISFGILWAFSLGLNFFG